MPIVDCTFTPIVHEDDTFSRIFYLIRRKDNPEDVYIVTASLSTQSYEIIGLYQEGAAAILSFSFINDTRATNVSHFFAIALGYPYTDLPNFEVYQHAGETSDGKLRFFHVPINASLDSEKEVQTAMRRGFYLKEANAQSNIKNMHYELADDPITVMSVWDWRGSTVLRDSWAWVHCIHILFAISTVFNLLILFLLIARNLMCGRIWIGDAFASVSNTLSYRGALVLISWYFNEYWSLLELCFAAQYEVASIQPIIMYPEISHADFLTLYLCSVDILGYICKERIDPAFAILVFECGFQLRVDLSSSMPGPVKQYLTNVVNTNFAGGMALINTILPEVTPLRFWDAHRLSGPDFSFILASVSPNQCITFTCAVGYIIARKLYRRYHPVEVRRARVATYQSGTEETLSQKRTLTLFEIATGAELQNRFGVISDYDNFVYFKGLKFASADGIYCNGFVIANGKFLIATEDIAVIIVMKLLNVRLRNVYTYEVDGSKLKQTAQLVYPKTISWTDLRRLNLSILL
uniref:Uncharacterized protein n=1 Tax=Globisporangium ultimum (strain ATCC 200006 / CBS 805.95 / DAOM BR144) TaxID=431595 RepID=K3WYV5_GLOUD